MEQTEGIDHKDLKHRTTLRKLATNLLVDTIDTVSRVKIPKCPVGGNKEGCGGMKLVWLTAPEGEKKEN